MEENKNVHNAIKFLVLKARNNGWGCTAGSAMGDKFQGPGSKEDTCPYANLLMLKVLAHTKNWKHSAAAYKGTEALLELWENSYHKHPYLFKMGSDFRKLKAPLIWYDLLHVTDVLSQFSWVRKQPRFLEIINLLIGMGGKGRLGIWPGKKSFKMDNLPCHAYTQTYGAKSGRVRDHPVIE